MDMLKRRLPLSYARELEASWNTGKLLSLIGMRDWAEDKDKGGWLPLCTEPDKKKRDDDCSIKNSNAVAGGNSRCVEEEESAEDALLNQLAAIYERKEGGGTGSQNLMFTECAEQALDLLLRSLAGEGGAVLVETPTSPGALELMRRHGVEAVPVACDRDGMLPDDLRRKSSGVEYRPVLVYVTPQYSNPSGRVWSRERKIALLQVSAELHLTVVENETTGGWLFDEAWHVGVSEEENMETGPKSAQAADLVSPTESLYQLCWSEEVKHSEVIAMGSFEGTFALPSRLAWLRGAPELLARLRRACSAEELRGAERAAGAGQLRAWLEQPPAAWRAAAAELAAVYAARRAGLLALLQAPPWRGAAAEDPGGGRYLWVRLPAGVSSEALLRASLRHGTAFLPGTLCCAGEPDDADAYIRLSLAAQDDARLREGVARLTAALAEFTARSAE